MPDDADWIPYDTPRVRFVCGRHQLNGCYRIGVYWGRRKNPKELEGLPAAFYKHAVVFHWVWMAWLERS